MVCHVILILIKDQKILGRLLIILLYKYKYIQNCKTGSTLELLGDCYCELGEFELSNEFYEEATHCKRGGASIDVMEKNAKVMGEIAIKKYRSLIDPTNINVQISDNLDEIITIISVYYYINRIQLMLLVNQFNLVLHQKDYFYQDLAI